VPVALKGHKKQVLLPPPPCRKPDFYPDPLGLPGPDLRWWDGSKWADTTVSVPEPPKPKTPRPKKAVILVPGVARRLRSWHSSWP
jgi:hypothetical protein